MQSRWKSPVLIAAVIAQVVSLLILFGLIDTTLGDKINQAAALLLQVLALVGVVNNPTNPDGL
ncbi:MAG: phage holin [Kiritimatiellales bacterium]